MPERRIIGFLEGGVADVHEVGHDVEVGHGVEVGRPWVAELSCGHRRRVGHSPPAEVHPWVLDPEGRASHLGSWIECSLCEEDPEGGELACYASFVCPECGSVLDDTHATH